MRSSQKTKWTDEKGAKRRIQIVGHRIPRQDRAPPQKQSFRDQRKKILTSSSHSLMKTELENCKKEKEKNVQEPTHMSRHASTSAPQPPALFST